MTDEYYHINDDDRRILNRHRYERLLSAIPYLENVFVRFGEDSLDIHCYKPIELETLLGFTFKEILCQQVYTFLGVHHLTVCDRDIPVWTVRLPAKNIESVEDGFSSEEFAMSTATLSPSIEASTATIATQKQPEPAPAGILPGQNLKDIAADLGRSVAEVRKWCKSQGMTLIPYSGEEVLSGESAQATYTHFLGEIQQAMVKRGLAMMPAQDAKPVDESIQTNGANAEETKEPTKPARTTQRSTTKTTATKPAAKTPAKGTAAKRKTGTRKSAKTA